jgi:hypothetical protein
LGVSGPRGSVGSSRDGGSLFGAPGIGGFTSSVTFSTAFSSAALTSLPGFFGATGILLGGEHVPEAVPTHPASTPGEV